MLRPTFTRFSMPKKILIAEDDNFLQKMVTVSLQEEGFDVITANDGEQALQQLEKEKPDLMLLDILMPKLDGFAVLEKLKEQGNNVPIIVMSNLGQEEDVEKCKNLGAKDYCIKSDMEPGDLAKQVKKYM